MHRKPTLEDLVSLRSHQRAMELANLTPEKASGRASANYLEIIMLGQEQIMQTNAAILEELKKMNAPRRSNGG